MLNNIFGLRNRSYSRAHRSDQSQNVLISDELEAFRRELADLRDNLEEESNRMQRVFQYQIEQNARLQEDNRRSAS